MLRRALFGAAFLFVLGVGAMAADAGGGCHPPDSTTEGRGLLVSIKNCAFNPAIIHVPVGSAVTWTNDDYLPHAVNGTGFDATDKYTSINPGVRVVQQFDRAGIYPYMCYVHPGMAGVIVVGDVALNPNADGGTQADSRPAGPVAPEATAPPATMNAPTVIGLVILAALLGYAVAVASRYR